MRGRLPLEDAACSLLLYKGACQVDKSGGLSRGGADHVFSWRPYPGLTRTDHFGVTVPDLNQAHEFFTGVLGCEYLYTLGPFQHDDSWMGQHLNVADDTVMRRLHFYRLGGQAIFEVFEYEAAEQSTPAAANSDVGGTTMSPCTSRTSTPPWRTCNTGWADRVRRADREYRPE